MPLNFSQRKKTKDILEITTTSVGDLRLGNPVYSNWYDSYINKLYCQYPGNGYLNSVFPTDGLMLHSQMRAIATPSATAGDADYVYISSGGSGSINKFARQDINSGLANYTTGALQTVTLAAVTGLDASLPNHLLAACQDGTNGHGIYLLNKSDLTTAAYLRGTGSGDGQFNTPKGIRYYAGYVYVADSANNRVVKVAVDTATPALTFSANLSHATYTKGASSVETDGTNWYVGCITSGGKLYKLDSTMQNSSAEYNTATCETITLIPDLGDGVDGTNPTLIIQDYRTLRRLKTSDLTQIASNGQTGTADNFDPIITGVAGTWKFSDGRSVYAPAGADFTWNGKSGYPFSTPGPNKAWFYPGPGGLAAITGITADSDLITKIRNLERTSATSINLSTNPALTQNILYVPKTCVSNQFASCGNNVYGTIDTLPPNQSVVMLTNDASITGNLSSLKGNSLTYLYMDNCTLIRGSLTDLSAHTQMINLLQAGCTGIDTGSIAPFTKLNLLYVYGHGWTADKVDTVLLSASDATWADLNAFTTSNSGTGPTVLIGGTNAAPGGTVAASTTNPMTTPGSGNTDTDWQWTTGSAAMLLGSITELTISGSHTTGETDYQRFSAMPGIVDSIKLWVSTNTNIKVALYSDSSAAPGTILAYSGEVAVTTGWNVVPLNTPITVTAGTNYWIGVKRSVTLSTPYSTAISGTYRWQGVPYSTDFTDNPTGLNTASVCMRLAGMGSAHKALTGQAACFYLANATGYPTHKWTITKT